MTDDPALTGEGNTYFKSLAWPIEHFFRNPVAFARMAHLGMFPPETPIEYQKWQRTTVDGWRDLLGKSLPEYGNYTKQNLARLVKVAEESDWGDIETIVRLYEIHAEIDGELFEREKVFPSR